MMVLNLHTEYGNLTSANTNGKPDMLTRKVLNEKFMQQKKYLTSIKKKKNMIKTFLIEQNFTFIL